MLLLIEGNLYKVEKRLKSRKTGKILVGIYNEKRQQYEVYYSHQSPMLVPQGTDETSMNVAMMDAIESIKRR